MYCALGWRESNPRRPSQNVTGPLFRLNHSAKGAVQPTTDYTMNTIQIQIRSKVQTSASHDKVLYICRLRGYAFLWNSNAMMLTRKPFVSPAGVGRVSGAQPAGRPSVTPLVPSYSCLACVPPQAANVCVHRGHCYRRRHLFEQRHVRMASMAARPT